MGFLAIFLERLASFLLSNVFHSSYTTRTILIALKVKYAVADHF